MPFSFNKLRNYISKKNQWQTQNSCQIWLSRTGSFSQKKNPLPSTMSPSKMLQNMKQESLILVSKPLSSIKILPPKRKSYIPLEMKLRKFNLRENWAKSMPKKQNKDLQTRRNIWKSKKKYIKRNGLRQTKKKLKATHGMLEKIKKLKLKLKPRLLRESKKISFKRSRKEELKKLRVKQRKRFKM